MWGVGSTKLLCAALVLDLFLGDPVYRLHPVRLMGTAISRGEATLRRLGWDGRGGGLILSLGLSLLCLGIYAGISLLLRHAQPWVKNAFEIYAIYSLLSLGDLLRHVRRVSSASDEKEARVQLAKLVGRDVEPLDAQACRRAALESLAESAVDGVWSPLFWYALLGTPGLILFKVANTLDSMIGYKDDRYLRFGWFGARWDDFMNYVPARLSWLMLSAAAWILPGFSGRGAFQIGWEQHGILPSPNSGWPEAAMAGALGIRLVGPVYQQGILVTDLWLGDPAHPSGASARDVARGMGLTCLATALWFVFILPWLR